MRSMSNLTADSNSFELIWNIAKFCFVAFAKFHIASVWSLPNFAEEVHDNGCYGLCEYDFK